MAKKILAALLLASVPTFVLVGAACAAEPISFTTFDVPGAAANDIADPYFVPGLNEDGVIRWYLRNRYRCANRLHARA